MDISCSVRKKPKRKRPNRRQRFKISKRKKKSKSSKSEKQTEGLFKAIRKNRILLVRKLIKNGANVNKKNLKQETPLAVALNQVPENFEIIKELLQHASLRSKNGNNLESALHIALRLPNSIRVVRTLIEAGADVNARAVWNVTPIMYAIECLTQSEIQSEYKLDFIRVLLKNGASLSLTDKCGKTPLHIAARENACVKLIRLFLKNGANIDAQDSIGTTPLTDALRKKVPNFKLIKELLKQGASVDIVDKYGDTPLHVALRARRRICVIREIIKYRPRMNKRNFNRETPLFTALSVVKHNLDIVEEIYSHGAINLPKNLSKENPLHVAAKNTEDFSVHLIKKYGKNFVNDCDNKGNTPIFNALSLGSKNANVVEELLAYGASLNITNKKGKTPLHFALKYGTNIELVNHIFKRTCEMDDIDTPLLCALANSLITYEIIKELIARGASCRQLDDIGDTVLHVAIKSGHSVEVIREILKQEVEINKVNLDGETPIFFACASWINNYDVIRALISHGAIINLSDFKKRSPLQMAVRYEKSLEILEELVENGADPNAGEKSGNTPLSELTVNHFMVFVYLLELTQWGASVHKGISYIFDVEKERLTKFDIEFIKLALIEHHPFTSCEYCDALLRTFPELVKKLMFEIIKMVSCEVCNTLNLYNVVIFGMDYGIKFNKDDDKLRSETFAIGLICDYPLYRKIILHRLQTRTYFLKYFYDIPIIYLTNNRHVVLCYGIMVTLGKYLSKRNLINILTAFNFNFNMRL